MSSDLPGPMRGIPPRIEGLPYPDTRVSLGHLCMEFQPVVLFRRQIGKHRVK